MKVYISVDIEGATGVTSFSQCSRPDSQHFDFPFARRMLTGDVNAAIRGAREAGATQVVVKDSHATCKNLLVDELEAGVQLISGYGWGRLGMMEGIDGSFDACMLIGYHAMAGSFGMMEHALVGGLHRLLINRRPAGEITVSAAVAGAFGVPTVLVTGDTACCDEAANWVDGVKCVSTKQGVGRSMGVLRQPSETWPEIQAAAKSAVAGAAGVEPFSISGPVVLDVSFRTSEEASMARQSPISRMTDAYAVSIEAPDFLEAHHRALNVFQLSIAGRKSGD